MVKTSSVGPNTACCGDCPATAQLTLVGIDGFLAEETVNFPCTGGSEEATVAGGCQATGEDVRAVVDCLDEPVNGALGVRLRLYAGGSPTPFYDSHNREPNFVLPLPIVCGAGMVDWTDSLFDCSLTAVEVTG